MTDSDPAITPLVDSQGASAAVGLGGATTGGAPELVAASQVSDASAEVQKLTDSEQVTQAREQREATVAKKAADVATSSKTCVPTRGTLTSAFGARWGTSHLGIDMANSIGAPIYAAAEGTVIEAGPASGFGLWVRIQLADGTIHVYGHMNSFSVRAGQKVKCGQRIAEIGNRGQSTGPHLHFEVWEDGTKKIDPRSWLAARGVTT